MLVGCCDERSRPRGECKRIRVRRKGEEDKGKGESSNSKCRFPKIALSSEHPGLKNSDFRGTR